MSGWLFCCGPRRDMGAALSHSQEGGCSVEAPGTIAEVIRERKKKSCVGSGAGGLATLRRRLAAAAARRARACTRAHDRGDRGRGGEHGRALRSAASSWRPGEISALHDQLEALAALRDLAVQAELARAPAPALSADVATLYKNAWSADVELLYRGASFPVHRAILAARCPYFRDLLSVYPGQGVRVCVEGLPSRVDAALLHALLLTLYGGEADLRMRKDNVRDCCGSRTSDLDNIGADSCDNTGWWNPGCSRTLEPSALRRLSEELGFDPHALHRDMRYLLDSGDYADASLVFSSEGLQGPERGPLASSSGSHQPQHQRTGSDYGFRPRLEIPCHRAVLSARSPFFRNIIVRRSRQLCSSDSLGGHGQVEARGRGWQPTVRIALDERVVPRRFARALLHAAYTDQVDLNLIGRFESVTVQNTTNTNSGNMPWNSNSSSSSAGNSNAVQARMPSQLEDAMELYEIGRFLELDIVVQGCEDAIAEALSPGTLAGVLRWSRLPHASRWIHRQAARYLRDDFAAVVQAPSLAALQPAELQEALASPFLQASEGMALKAAIKWAERALFKKLEDREPNVVSQTAHSVARRGLRRRDLCDSELREIVSPLLPSLRLEHILPAEADILHQAIRRGLVSAAPPHVIEGTVPGSAAAWLGRGPYRTPRLFMPYLEEVKALLEEQQAGEADVARTRRNRHSPHIPDTLYMVSTDRRTHPRPHHPVEAPLQTDSGDSLNATTVAPPADTLLCARARRRELRAAPICVRALSLPLARAEEIDVQICLRAVRELGLPDCVATQLGPAELGPAELEPCGGAGQEPCDRCSGTAAQHHGVRPESRVSLRARTPVGARGQAVDLCLEAPVFVEGALEAPRGYHSTVNRCSGSGTSSLGRRDTLSLSCRVPDVAAATVSPRPDVRPDVRLDARPDARRQDARRHERLYTDGNRHLLQEYSTGGGGGSVLRAVHRTAHRLAREWQGEGGGAGAGGGLQLDLGDGTAHAPAQQRPGSGRGRSLLCGTGAGAAAVDNSTGGNVAAADAPPSQAQPTSRRRDQPNYTAATMQALASLQCRTSSQTPEERSDIEQDLLQAYGMGYHQLHQLRALSPTLTHPLNTPSPHPHIDTAFVQADSAYQTNSHPNNLTTYNTFHPQTHSYNPQAQPINYKPNSIYSQTLSLSSQPHSLNARAHESPFCTYKSTRSVSNLESCNSNLYRCESPANNYNSAVLNVSNSRGGSPFRTLETCQFPVREGSLYGRIPDYGGVSRLDPGFTLTSRSCSPNRTVSTHSHHSVSRTLSNSPGNARVLANSPGNSRILANSPSVSSSGFKSESSSRPPSRDSRVQSSSGSISAESPGQGSTRGSGRSERGFRSLDSGNNGPPRFL